MSLSEKNTNEAIEDLEIMYCTVKRYDNNSEFLFAIEMADNMEIDRLKVALKENNISVIIQENLIKIPEAGYRNHEDLQKLINCFRLSVSF